jgi:actin-related protein
MLGSPSGGSGGRIEDEAVVIELGCRKVRIGFAGDSTPKRILSFDAEEHRRTGDLRAWEAGYDATWRDRMAGRPWAYYQELYQLDCRGQDLALVGDRLERGLRDAFAKYLLIDSKPRRMSLVLPPALPLPLISVVLDTLFGRFQPPSISLLSAPCATTFAAGVRSALVVNIGWHETTVTGVYEYREVSTTRTVRAGKLLLEETRNFLVDAIEGRQQASEGERTMTNDFVSFEDCEEVAARMLWCKKVSKSLVQETSSEGLPTLHEQDESEEVDPAEDSTPTSIYLPSCSPPKTVQVPFSRLSEPCENTFFQTPYAPANFDDHELPLHLLVYLSLLKLPLDVRAICMSRIIFTGGCSNVLGLRGRIFDEVCLLAQQRGWDPMQGRGVEAYKNNPKLKRNGTGNAGGGSQPANESPVTVVVETAPDSPEGEEQSHLVQNPAHAPTEEDPVEDMIRKEKNYKPPVQGRLRSIDTLGAWAGASMASQLKIPALAMVDREAWLLQGLGGASRPNEVDVQAQQKQSRQSMGAGGLIRGQGGQGTNWTLGVFGAV